MDVDECDKKRYEYIDDLTDLERQFAILREQYVMYFKSKALTT